MYSSLLQISNIQGPEQTLNCAVYGCMSSHDTYQKLNWDWVFTLPFIILMLYLLL